MKLDVATHETVVMGAAKPIAQFGIRNEDMSFVLEILRSQIYKDPILAVIREYTTNAKDAHGLVGKKDKAIVVRVPTYYDCSFTIRDFGPGLNPQEIVDVFCNYGNSTKRNDNSSTGMLGIGSKSGFAYGDNFTITSFKDGKKHTYNAIKDASGCGSVVLLSEEDVDINDTGIEICVPARSSDIYNFNVAAQKVFKHFSLPVDINLTINKPSFWKSGDNWGIELNATPTIIMGEVSYSIDASKFPDFEDFINLGLAMRVEIGVVDIAASREELKYTDKTINYLTEKFEKVCSSVAEIILSDINKFTNLVELSNYVINLDKTSATIVRQVCKGQTWNGFKIAKKHALPINDKWQIDYVNTDGTRSPCFQGMELDFGDDFTFVVLDTNSDKEKLAYFKRYVGPYHKVFCLVRKDGFDQNEFDKAFPLPADKFKLFSTLPAPPPEVKTVYERVVRSSYGKKIVKLAPTNKIFSSPAGDDWVPLEDSDYENPEKIYVIIDRFRIRGYYQNSDVGLIRDAFSILLNKPINIYGVKDVNHISGNTEFIKLEDFAKKNEAAIKSVAIPILNRNNAISSLMEDFNALIALAQCISIHADISEIKTLADKINSQNNAALEKLKLVDIYNNLSKFMKLTADDEQAVQEMSGYLKSLKSQFKFYRFIRNSAFTSDDVDFVSFVKQLLTVA